MREIIVKEYRNEQGLITRREIGQELVRCKECKYERDGEEFMWCEHPNGLDSIVKPDDFCSYGEREDE